MRRSYEAPEAKLLELSGEDIMTTSPGLSLGGEGNEGGNISFNDWLNKLGSSEEGRDGLEVDINDQMSGLS